MKSTKIMLAVLAVFILTWMIVGLIGYLLSDGFSYKQCLTHMGTVFTMLLIGWLPAVIVGNDLDDKL